MGKLILITGGSRSGKSDFALKLGNSLSGPRRFIATSPILDAEMAERAQRHRRLREGGGWDTLEEMLDLEKAIAASVGHRALLIDCLTLWVNNLLWEAEKRFFHTLAEDEMAEYAHRLCDTCRGFDGVVIAVTNEVGMGIVPEAAAVRRFRDLAGRCNTVMAAAADEVWLCISGIAVRIKPPGGIA